MNIEQTIIDKTKIVLALSGRFDTANAPLIESKIKQVYGECDDLVLDFAQLSYISSMGLRVLLHTKKTATEEGKRLIIININDTVRDVFEITGFLGLLVQDEKFMVMRKDEGDGIVLSLNGRMAIENAPMVSKALIEIRDQYGKQPQTVIVDMEGLIDMAHGACKHLKQAITDTAWETRTLVIRNAGANLLPDLRQEGLTDA